MTFYPKNTKKLNKIEIFSIKIKKEIKFKNSVLQFTLIDPKSQ